MIRTLHGCLFYIVATVVGIAALFLVQILRSILESIDDKFSSLFIQLESKIFLDEATYNVVKKKGFKDGYIFYSYNEVDEECKRLDEEKSNGV